MKVAIIAPPWVPVPPPAYGGTEAVFDNLARGLADVGHDVLLFATGDSACEVPIRYVLERAAGTVATGSATELRHVINATLLRLDPWAPRQQLSIAPALPAHIRRLHVDGIIVDGHRVRITVDGDDVEVSGLDGYDVATSPRPPLTALPEPS